MLDEDEVKAFVEILNERPPSVMARIAALADVLPVGIPEDRDDVKKALADLKQYLAGRQ